jgi:phage nucleotide-binding protein
MADVMCLYGPPGSGKTINSTRLPGKTLLLSSDNSARVLRNFDRPNLTIKPVKSFKEFVDSFNEATSQKKFDNIIVDCLTDIIDAYIVEVRVKGFSGDIRQYYLNVYTTVKDLVRNAAYCETNVVFNCWEDMFEKTLPSGEIVNYIAPAIPAKIRNNVCGLCNIVAYVTTANDKQGNKQWYYITEGSPALMAKDQLYMRKNCLPEDAFKAPETKK